MNSIFKLYFNANENLDIYGDRTKDYIIFDLLDSDNENKVENTHK